MEFWEDQNGGKLPGDLTCLVAAHLTWSEGATEREMDLNPTAEREARLKSEERLEEEEVEEERRLGFMMGEAAAIILLHQFIYLLFFFLFCWERNQKRVELREKNKSNGW